MAATKLAREAIWKPDKTCFGKVITNRYLQLNGKLIPSGFTTNAGIACYVCEYLCSDEKALFSDKNPTMWIKILIRQISEQAVSRKGLVLWSWESRPSRPDYIYPPDWDDTCKAIDAIRTFEKRYGSRVEIHLPSLQEIGRLLCNSVYTSSVVGGDTKHKCKNDLALYMFIADENEKPNNTEDILVTAVTVRTFFRHYSIRSSGLLSILQALTSRLVEVADWGISNAISFQQISRCYFSWGLFLLLLKDIAEYATELAGKVETLIEQYLDKELYQQILPPGLVSHLLQDEFCYATILVKHIGWGNENKFREKLTLLAKLNTTTKKGILYRHRRLGHYYGSQVWACVLERIAKVQLIG